MSIELVMPSNHLILCFPVLLLSLTFPSIRVFSNESVLHIRWPKFWSFSFSISPSNEYSGVISFRINWFDLLAVQGTLKSLLQHHSSKALILWSSIANLFLARWFAWWLCLASTLCARHSARQWGYSLEKQCLCSKGAHVPVKEGDRKQVCEIILDSDLLRKEKQEDLWSSGFSFYFPRYMNSTDKFKGKRARAVAYWQDSRFSQSLRKIWAPSPRKSKNQISSGTPQPASMEPPFWKAPNKLSPLTVPLICSVCYFPLSLFLSVLFPMLCSGRCSQKPHVISFSITAQNSQGRDSDWLSLGQVSTVNQSAVRWSVCMLLWKHGCCKHRGKRHEEQFSESWGQMVTGAGELSIQHTD